jgi:hypothetical protein
LVSFKDRVALSTRDKRSHRDDGSHISPALGLIRKQGNDCGRPGFNQPQPLAIIRLIADKRLLALDIATKYRQRFRIDATGGQTPHCKDALGDLIVRRFQAHKGAPIMGLRSLCTLSEKQHPEANAETTHYR